MNNSTLNATVAAPVRCCHNSSIGVDVHSKILVCCEEKYDPLTGTLEVAMADFPTSISGLERFANWCLAHNPEIVLMESTSVYWRSPYEALEDVGFDNSRLAVVKATDVKAALGRKTDKEDARRLAEFARIGRIKHSYVPPRDFREARCVARAYHKAMGKKTSAINRLHRVFCEIGCRPGSVFSDITGKTAMTILISYINDTPEEFEMTVMASRKLKASREEILDVFHNRVSDSLKRLLKVLMRTVENCERDAAEYLEILEQVLSPYGHLIDRLMTIPGIKKVSALKILSELGPNLDAFGSIRSFCSWIAVCPGNHESAGKRYGGCAPKGNSYLKTYLVEVAQAIGRMKEHSNNLRVLFQAFKETRGHNRTIVAVAHKLARIIYALFKNGGSYIDKKAGRGTLHKVRAKRLQRCLRGLTELGVKLNVTLAEEATPQIVET